MTDKVLKKILYAEDESDIREITKIALEDIGGFDLIYCTNGEEAIVAAKNSNPDLLLLDVMMPKMDGPTALVEIRKLPELNAIPAIFMTAKIQNNEIARYKTLGVLDVIKKPFDPVELANTIKSIWEKREKPL